MLRRILKHSAGRALLAVTVVIAMLASVEIYVRLRLRHHLGTFSERMSPAKLSGNVLETIAFTSRDTLPIFGSSELNRPAPNRADLFFAHRPTGFSAFPIGRGGNTCLIMTQKLAAVGRAAAGRKVAIFLSPTWFIRTAVSEGAVEGNVAPLQMGSWIFGDVLSPSLKQRIASRLLDYPEAFSHQPLIAMALRCLQQNTGWDRARFALMRPLGEAQDLLLERLDFCAVLREIITFQGPRHRAEDAKLDLGPRPGRELDWKRLAVRAEQRDLARGSANQYSVGAPAFEAGHEPAPSSAKGSAAPAGKHLALGRMVDKPMRDRDAEFLKEIREAKEWTDLALLLDTLKNLHADPIFISQPFNGVYRDLAGNTAGARRAFYEKLHAFIDPTGYPLLDFSEDEEDRDFFNDNGHPSGKAWIYYDQALSKFYGQHS